MRKTTIAMTVASLFAVSLPALAGVGVADETAFQTMAANEEGVMPLAPSPGLPSNVFLDDLFVYFDQEIAESWQNFTGSDDSITDLTGGQVDSYHAKMWGARTTWNLIVGTGAGFYYPAAMASLSLPNLKNVQFTPTASTTFQSLAADGNSGSIINDRDGTIEFNGGSSAGVYCFQKLANGSGSVATIRNEGGGSIVIRGGSAANASAINKGTDYGFVVIENLAGGTVSIQGGASSGAYGINCGAITDGSENTRFHILNRSEGTLVIEGKLADAIHEGASVGGYKGADTDKYVFYLLNEEGATLKILGNAEFQSWGIGTLYLDRLDQRPGGIENAGLLEMNSRAIGSFGQGEFVNKPTGTVQAEVGTLFEGGSVTQTTKTISLSNTVVLPDGTTTEVGSGGTVEATVYESTGTWTMKSDWATKATFEDGGTIIFTNLNEGSAAAADIKAKFQDVFGEGTTIQFAPAVAGGGSGSGSLDASGINDVLASNDGAVFFDKDFTASGTLNISDQGDLRGSTGFQKLTGAERVEIGAGKRFTLLGDGSNVTSALINLVENASLDLGSAADAVKGAVTQGGALGAIQGSGAVNIRHGNFTSTGMSGTNAVSVAAGASLVANAIESGAVQALGRFASASTLTAHGNVQVDTAGSVRGTTIRIEGGDLSNQGVTSANRLDVQGNITNTGIVDAKEFVAPTGEYLSAGTEIYQSFKNQGVLVITDATNMIIGDLARKDYLLSHLDVARKLLEAGSSLPSEVTAALEAQGLDVAAIAAQALEVGTPEEPETESAESQPESAESETEPVATLALTPAAQAQQESIPSVRPTLPTWEGALTSMALLHAAQDAYALEAHALQSETGAWATILHDRSEFDVYEGKRDGIRIGLQGSDGALTAGVALSYADGSVDFEDERDADFMAGALYGSYRFGPAFVAGTASYGRDRIKDGDKLTSDVLAASLKAGAAYELTKSMEVIPHVGIRILRVKTDEADTARLVQYPLGITMQGRADVSGWNVQPKADVSFVWNTGDRKVNVRDVQSAVAGSHLMQAALGLAAQKGAWTVGLDYVGAFGSEKARSHSLNLKAVLTF